MPALLSPSNRMSAKRLDVFQQLGLLPYLEQRQLLTFSKLPLHCEWYHHSDDAPWVLFIPGIGTYSELYCEMLAKMSQRGFNLLSIDLPGHGYSGGPRGSYQLDTLVTQIGEVIDHIEQSYSGPITLFGCSIGSRIALALAESDPRIKALMCHTLLINEVPPDIFHGMGWQALSMGRWMMPGMEADFRTFIDIDNILEHNPMGEFARQDTRIVWNYPIATLDSLYSASSQILEKSLEIPAAIIVGEHDDVLPPSYIRRLVAQSAQPFDLFEVSDAAHMLPFDQVDITVETVSEWLKEVL
ncbi:MAG: alpha/beta hydrolase [Halopseudomonas sp.]